MPAPLPNEKTRGNYCICGHKDSFHHPDSWECEVAGCSCQRFKVKYHCDAIPLEAVARMKRENWPTLEEQRAYWDEKLKDPESDPIIMIMRALEQYFGAMQEASEKLKGQMADVALGLKSR